MKITISFFFFLVKVKTNKKNKTTTDQQNITHYHVPLTFACIFSDVALIPFLPESKGKIWVRLHVDNNPDDHLIGWGRPSRGRRAVIQQGSGCRQRVAGVPQPGPGSDAPKSALMLPHQGHQRPKQPPDGGKTKGITLEEILSRQWLSRGVGAYIGAHVSGDCKCVLVCVSKPPSLVLNVIAPFTSGRTEGGRGFRRGREERERKDGGIQRRSKEENQENKNVHRGWEWRRAGWRVKIKLSPFCFPRVHFLSCSPQDGLNPLPHKSYSWFLFFLPFLLLPFCFSAIISV